MTKIRDGLVNARARFSNLVRNTDPLPPLPLELTKELCIEWARHLEGRSEKFADRNRFASVFVSTSVNFALAITGASAFAAKSFENSTTFGIVIVVISAMASAINTLFSMARPDQLRIRDRKLQVFIWNEINNFTIETGEYAKDSACKEFVKRISDEIKSQVDDWERLHKTVKGS